jgi:branched-chain amino acid transport system ATP-binding protein
VLKLTDVVAQYGPIRALQGISIDVPAGQVVTILGANGAGKSTTLRTISGLLRPTAGAIEFDGKRIDGRGPESIVELGISHAPEGRQIFTQLTVLENLRLGSYARRDKKAVKEDLEEVFSYFPRLRERTKQVAGTLSGGEQQMLAIGRALMARPRLLLLDEPSLGLAPLLVRDIFRIIARINRDHGTTILLVEQDAIAALSIAHYGYVLETGRVVVANQADALRNDEALRRSYLGY